jgi:ribonuclease Z
MPAFGRGMSAHAVVHWHRMMLVDCGEGTQMQMRRYDLKLKHLDAIFITHLHGDHVFGLPGLLTTLSMNNRAEPLELFAPVGVKDYLKHTLAASDSVLRFELKIVEIESNAPAHVVYENRGLTVTAFPLRHTVPCHGFLFREKPKRKPFLYAKAVRDGLPVEYFQLVKQGVDVHPPGLRPFLAEDYLGEPDAPRAYAYCSDTRFFPELAETVGGVDVLYHEATFLDDLRARAQETGHSTAMQAAIIAREAGARRLIMGHFSARYSGLDGHKAEAARVFAAAHPARDGEIVHIGKTPAISAKMPDGSPAPDPAVVVSPDSLVEIQ